MYLIYDDYLAYGGTLDKTLFNKYERDAEALINYRTFNRLKTDTDIPVDVKKLIVVLIALAELRNTSLTLGLNAETDTNAIISQSNDGVSITYNSMSTQDLFNNCKKEANSAITEYLEGITNEAGQKLLYRGLYTDE